MSYKVSYNQRVFGIETKNDSNVTVSGVFYPGLDSDPDLPLSFQASAFAMCAEIFSEWLSIAKIPLDDPDNTPIPIFGGQSGTPTSIPNNTVVSRVTYLLLPGPNPGDEFFVTSGDYGGVTLLNLSQGIVRLVLYNDTFIDLSRIVGESNIQIIAASTTSVSIQSLVCGATIDHIRGGLTVSDSIFSHNFSDPIGSFVKGLVVTNSIFMSQNNSATGFTNTISATSCSVDISTNADEQLTLTNCFGTVESGAQRLTTIGSTIRMNGPASGSYLELFSDVSTSISGDTIEIASTSIVKGSLRFSTSVTCSANVNFESCAISCESFDISDCTVNMCDIIVGALLLSPASSISNSFITQKDSILTLPNGSNNTIIAPPGSSAPVGFSNKLVTSIIL